MSEQQLIFTIIVFLVGLICGVLLTLITNKVRSGRASPSSVKREMNEYQDKVEAHFDETSEKFKQMAAQYQDLYKHLSVGATTLCRPENIAPGLVADEDPLSKKLAIDKKPEVEEKPKVEAAKKSNDKKDDPETDAKIKADLEKLKTEKAKSAQTAKVDEKK